MGRRKGAVEPQEAGERRAAGRPARLSRELVVDAAVAIARGMDTLTMRALAATPMAVYRHVGDRDELAFLVVDRVMSQMELPDSSLPALAWLRVLAREVRDVGRVHRGVMDVLLEEGPAVRSSLAILDAVVRSAARRRRVVASVAAGPQAHRPQGVTALGAQEPRASGIEAPPMSQCSPRRPMSPSKPAAPPARSSRRRATRRAAT